MLASLARHLSRAALLASGTVAALSCYSADFDERASGVYSCEADADCSEGYVCDVFACVDDTGPRVQVLGPEPLSRTTFGEAELEVTVEVGELTFTQSSGHDEGEGFVQILLDGEVVVTRYDEGDAADGVVVPVALDGLGPGPHHLTAMAMFGDDVPYPNPSASAHSVFFLDDGSPQAAIVSPAPNSLHLVDRPLEVRVGTINFDMVVSGPACHLDAFEAGECEGLPDPATYDQQGHAHMYLLDDFPACLGGGDGGDDCVNKYVASVRPKSQEEAENPDGVVGEIEATSFTDPGIVWLSTGLQYSDHSPYPSIDDPIYDQFQIEIVDR